MNENENNRLITEFVDRWYLSDEGDSEALKRSSKGEMRRQMEAIVNSKTNYPSPILRDKIQVGVAEQLTGDYACTRVWGAWQVDTMTQDDFQPLEETVRAEEITDAVMQIVESDKRTAVIEELRHISSDEDGNMWYEDYSSGNLQLMSLSERINLLEHSSSL